MYCKKPDFGHIYKASLLKQTPKEQHALLLHSCHRQEFDAQMRHDVTHVYYDIMCGHGLIM